MGNELFQQFKVRLPADLKAWLAEQAAKNRRSQGAEIIYLLKEGRRREQPEAQQA